MPVASWSPAYVALGANLGDPRAAIDRALDAMGVLPQTRLVTVSSRYRSSPLGGLAQPDYVNAVAGVLTCLGALDLLTELQQIERRMGRQPQRERWASRPIDLDLLMHGRATRDTPDLVLPHPGIVQRNFVLFPLLEIAPAIEIPGLGPAAQWASRLDRSALTRLG